MMVVVKHAVGFLLCVSVYAAEKFEAELDTYVPPGGYILICIAILIGLGLIAALVFVIIKGKKAQISGWNPTPSTSDKKSSILDINRGKYFKEPVKKIGPEKKGPKRLFRGQQPISFEEKMLFRNGGTYTRTNDSNTTTPTSDYDLEQQSPKVVQRNKNILQRVFANKFSKTTTLSKFSAISSTTKSTNRRGLEFENKNTASTKSNKTNINSNEALTPTKDANRKRMVNKQKMSGNLGGSACKMSLSNINPKDVVRPTGNVPGNKQLQSSWDVAANKFGQSVKVLGSNRRIVGGFSKAVLDKMQNKSRENDDVNYQNKNWKFSRKNVGSNANPQRYIWSRKHLKTDMSLHGKSDIVKVENEISESTAKTTTRAKGGNEITKDNADVSDATSRQTENYQSNVAPRQTLNRSLSRTAIGTTEPTNRYSVMSNASVISRQVSSSSIMVRASPDDAKIPESTRPESTMVTVDEKPEIIEEQSEIIEEHTTIAKDINNGKNEDGVFKKSSPTPSNKTPSPTTKTPLKRTMSKSTIVPSKTDETIHKSMSRQMSRGFMKSESVTKPLNRQMSRSAMTAESTTKPLNRQMSQCAMTAESTTKPLNRQMSKSVINPANITKLMDRQMSRAMSKSILRLGEHALALGKSAMQEGAMKMQQEPMSTNELTDSSLEKTSDVENASDKSSDETNQMIEVKSNPKSDMTELEDPGLGKGNEDETAVIVNEEATADGNDGTTAIEFSERNEKEDANDEA